MNLRFIFFQLFWPFDIGLPVRTRKIDYPKTPEFAKTLDELETCGFPDSFFTKGQHDLYFWPAQKRGVDTLLGFFVFKRNRHDFSCFQMRDDKMGQMRSNKNTWGVPLI